MANFLIILAENGARTRARSLYESGLACAELLKGQKPLSTLSDDGTYVASFPRQNGSGAPIAANPESGNWLMCAGTWFHPAASGSKKENRLLECCSQLGCERVVNEMEGFFALAFGNKAQDETNIVTDLVGSYHCFLRTWPGISAISSSALLLSAIDDDEIDSLACQEFLCTGVIYENRTLHSAVRKLEPATCYRFRKGALFATCRYWQIAEIDPDSLKGSHAVEVLADSLVRAGRKIAAGFEKPVCDLTGGYDSRLLVAGLSKANFEFSTAVTGPPSSPDVTVSRALAGILGRPHLHIDPRPVESYQQLCNALQVTDGEYDVVDYARVHEVHRDLSQKFDISLNGSFGEVARGYWWELLIPHTGAPRRIDSFKIARLRFAAGNYNTDLVPPSLRVDLVSHLAEVINRTNKGIDHLPNTLQMDNIYLMMRMRCWQGSIASSTNQMWPCLSPFLFRSVLEAMLRTASRLRRRSLLSRLAIAELEPRLADYPLEHGYPPLPFNARTFYRFWPLASLYGKKCVSKLISRSPVKLPLVSQTQAYTPRLRLWDNGVAEEIFQPAKMNSGSFLDQNTLSQFLRSSKQPNFRYEGQWARLLTIELALRKRKDAQSARKPLIR